MIEQIRKNPFCVISINTYGENNMHDIQTNTAWSKNPYATNYAIVPDHMVQDIIETEGYCDITLNEDKTEIISFVAREIPEPEPTPEPTPESEKMITLQLTKEQYDKLMSMLD